MKEVDDEWSVLNNINLKAHIIYYNIIFGQKPYVVQAGQIPKCF